MNLAEFAEKYCRAHNYRRTPIHSANRFQKLSGVSEASAVTTQTIESFRVTAVSAKLSIWTIEKTVTDVLTLVRESTGRKLEPGRRINRPSPQPKPASLDAISAMYLQAPEWLQQLVALSYWTALRLSDAIAMQCKLSADMPDVLYWQANKTGKRHCWPIPTWLRTRLKPLTLPYKRSNCNAGKRVREAMWTACEFAGISTITPKQLRQRSVTEWSRANATAGSLIHGCGIGVLAHYIDPLSVLESAAPRVRLPAYFGADASQDAESGLLDNFRRLDPAAQGLIAGTAERLAAG